MSRAFDIVIGGVITTIATIIHTMSVELFAPNKPLHALASDGTGVLNGAARADLWFQMLSIWVPLMAIGGIWLFVLVREYRRQVQTARRPAR